MQKINFADLNPDLQSRFVDYFIRYDVPFEELESGDYAIDFCPQQAMSESKIKPMKKSIFQLVPQGQLFSFLDYNRYGDFLYFVKNYDETRVCKTCKLEEHIPQMSQKQFGQDFDDLIVFQKQNQRLSSFELYAEMFKDSPQNLVNFLFNIQMGNQHIHNMRTLSRFAEKNQPASEINPFFLIVNYLKVEFQLNHIQQIIQLNIPQSMIKTLSQQFFAKYYDHYVIEELENKTVNGDLMLFTLYKNYLRYGDKCRQIKQSEIDLKLHQQEQAKQQESNTLDTLSKTTINMSFVGQAEFSQAIQSVLGQFLQQIIMQFKLNELNQNKLINEINTIFRVYLCLLNNFDIEYSRYSQTVFLKKVDQQVLVQNIKDTKFQLSSCQQKPDVFELFTRILQSSIFKNYLDAFITSLVFMQNKE